ncbi:hypothetical protein Dimus_030968 [Dionaea muscipula]
MNSGTSSFGKCLRAGDAHTASQASQTPSQSDWNTSAWSMKLQASSWRWLDGLIHHIFSIEPVPTSSLTFKLADFDCDSNFKPTSIMTRKGITVSYAALDRIGQLQSGIT